MAQATGMPCTLSTGSALHLVASHQFIGAYKRVEALRFFFHVFKTILSVSLRRDEMLTWLIFYLFDNLSENN